MVHLFNHNYESIHDAEAWIPIPVWREVTTAAQGLRLRYISLLQDCAEPRVFNKTQARAILDEISAIHSQVDDPEARAALDDLMPIVEWGARYGGRSALMVQLAQRES